MALFGKNQPSSSFGKGQSPSSFGRSSFFSRPEFKKNQSSSQKPGNIFEKQKFWSKKELKTKIYKSEPYVKVGNKFYSRAERAKLLDKFTGSHLTGPKVKGVLQKLRKDEYWAKDFKTKKELGTLRKRLERETGIDKY